MLFGFARPLMFLGLLLLPVLALAYLFKKRGDVLKVPSTVLWRKLAVSRARSRLFRDLMRTVSLVSCLLAVAALITAAAGPMGRGRGRTVAVIVDVSASMGNGARGSALAAARREVRQLLARRSPRQRVVLIAAGDAPRHLAGPTASGAVLERALGEFEPSPGSADLVRATELALALVEHDADAEVHLVHDGGLGAGPSSTPPASARLHEHRVARAHQDNIGITALSAQPTADGESDQERELLVAVATSSSMKRRAEVVLEADGAELGRHPVEIEPGGSAEVRALLRAPAASVVARLAATDDVPDALSVDDEAHLAGLSMGLPAVNVVTEQVDSTRAFFLEQALYAAGVPEVTTGKAAPGAAARILLDTHPAWEETTPTLYLGTMVGPSPAGRTELLGTADARTLRSVDAEHPLLRGVALDSVTFESAAASVVVPEGAQCLVELDGGCVLLAGGTGPKRWVHLGVDVIQSDMPLRVAFPVFVANAVAWLSGSARCTYADAVPLSEVTLQDAEEPIARSARPEHRWPVPGTPAAALMLLAALLLGAEAVAWQKGWTS